MCDLESVIKCKPWVWFKRRVDGLLTVDSRLARHLQNSHKNSG